MLGFTLTLHRIPFINRPLAERMTSSTKLFNSFCVAGTKKSVDI